MSRFVFIIGMKSFLSFHSLISYFEKQKYDSVTLKVTGQGVIFPAGARVLPAGNMEEFTGNLNRNPQANVTFILIC
jgi:hypothetical protein